MSKKNKKPVKAPNPEEMQRIIDDAFKGSRLKDDLKLSPEEELLARLEQLNVDMRVVAHNASIRFPFRKDRQDLLNVVAKAYFERLDRFNKEEIMHLFAAFMATNLCSHY